MRHLHILKLKVDGILILTFIRVLCSSSRQQNGIYKNYLGVLLITNNNFRFKTPFKAGGFGFKIHF